MSKFVEWLEGLNQKDSRVRAVLRRSLSFLPGEYVPAFPYVEPFLNSDVNDWRRKILYLVAGLWAMHWRYGRSTPPLTIARACAVLDSEKRGKVNPDDRQKISSTEKRFITLLDADPDQLAYRLRQMVALLQEQAVDFETLINDLLYWNNEKKRTQHAWARQFYGQLEEQLKNEANKEEEK